MAYKKTVGNKGLVFFAAESSSQHMLRKQSQVEQQALKGCRKVLQNRKAVEFATKTETAA